jgi:hypothetical protein
MLRPCASRQSISPSRMASVTRNSPAIAACRGSETLVLMVPPRDESALPVSDVCNCSEAVVLELKQPVGMIERSGSTG